MNRLKRFGEWLRKIPMLLKSAGERIMATMLFRAGSGWGFTIWSQDRNELVRHLDGWNYVAINALAEEVACLNPNAAHVRGPDDVPVEKAKAWRKAGKLLNRAGRIRRKSLASIQEHEELELLDSDHRLVKLLHRPNPTDVGYTFWYRIIMALRLTGTAYIWMVLDGMGLPCELWSLNPAWVRPRPGNGKLVGWYDVYPWAATFGAGATFRFPEEEVIPIVYPHPYDPVDGYSPLTAGARWVDLAESQDSCRWFTFKNGIHSSIGVEIDKAQGDPDRQDIDRFKADLRARYQGEGKAGEPIVVAGGKLVNVGPTSPREMEFLGGAEQMRDFLLALHKTGKSVVGMAEDSTFASALAANAGYSQRAVRPQLVLMGQILSERLAPKFPGASRKVIYWDDPTPNDPVQLNADIECDLKGHAISPDEIRALRGREPWSKGGANPFGSPNDIELPLEEDVDEGMQELMDNLKPPPPAPGGPAPEPSENGNGEHAGELPTPRGGGQEPVNRIAEMNGKQGGGNGRAKKRESVGAWCKQPMLTASKGTWKPSEHPRGQPENAGQFGPGGAAKPAETPAEPPAEPASKPAESTYTAGSGEGTLYRTRPGNGESPPEVKERAKAGRAALDAKYGYHFVDGAEGLKQAAEFDPELGQLASLARDIVRADTSSQQDVEARFNQADNSVQIWSGTDSQTVALHMETVKKGILVGSGSRQRVIPDATNEEAAYLISKVGGFKLGVPVSDAVRQRFAAKPKSAGGWRKGQERASDGRFGHTPGEHHAKPEKPAETPAEPEADEGPDESALGYVSAFNEGGTVKPSEVTEANSELEGEGSDYRLAPDGMGKWTAMSLQELEDEGGTQWAIQQTFDGKWEIIDGDALPDLSELGDDETPGYVDAFNAEPASVTVEDLDAANAELATAESEYRLWPNPETGRWEPIALEDLEHEYGEDWQMRKDPETGLWETLTSGGESSKAYIRSLQASGLVSKGTWNESAHPRGQPENAGQFGSSGGHPSTDKPSPGHALTAPPEAHGQDKDDYGSKENPIKCGGDIKLAAKMLSEGKHIHLDQPDEVATLVDKMSAMIDKAMKLGKAAPTFDLCKVTVKGSNLFCQDTLGIPRIQMPQMRGVPVPGTHAATLPAGKKSGKVDMSAEFIAHLKSQGIATTETKVRASHLRASQNQIVGARVVQLINETNAGTRDLREKPIFVTRDNYIVDGHHHWAAIVGHGYAKGKDLNIPVYKLDMEIGQALDMANEFTKKAGLAPKSGKASTGRWRKGGAWKPDLHPRGQPENAGQFGSGGSKPTTAEPEKPAAAAEPGLHARATAKAQQVLVDFKAGYAKLAGKPVLKQIDAASDWLKDKTKQFYGVLEQRYGKVSACLIMGSGQAFGWGALGVGAMAGVPLYLPGSTLWGSLPAVALAEGYLQAKRGLAALRKDLSPSEVDKLGAELAGQLEQAFLAYMKEHAAEIQEAEETAQEAPRTAQDASEGEKAAPGSQE